MTQTDRVHRALARAGARGITAVDFAAPYVVDGGAPIMRVAARVKDLRDAGIPVVTDGERDSCAVYKLLGAAPGPEADSPPAATSAMPASQTAAGPAASSTPGGPQLNLWQAA